MPKTSLRVRCPACEHMLTGYTGEDHDELPSPGNSSVCTFCAAAVVFNSDLTLRLATVADVDNLSPAEVDAMCTATKTVLEKRRTVLLLRGEGDWTAAPAGPCILIKEPLEGEPQTIAGKPH